MRKHIKITKAKQLQESINLFTQGSIALLGDWELQNDDGTKHSQSDDFVKAVKDLTHNRNIILHLLDQYKVEL